METKSTYYTIVAKSYIYRNLDIQQLKDNFDAELMFFSNIGNPIWFKSDVTTVKIKKWFLKSTGTNLPSYSELKNIHEGREKWIQERIKETYKK